LVCLVLSAADGAGLAGTGDELVPEPRPPRGIEHHHASLAVATFGANGTWASRNPTAGRRCDG
jgi:hypothetical protein